MPTQYSCAIAATASCTAAAAAYLYNRVNPSSHRLPLPQRSRSSSSSSGPDAKQLLLPACTTTTQRCAIAPPAAAASLSNSCCCMPSQPRALHFQLGTAELPQYQQQDQQHNCCQQLHTCAAARNLCAPYAPPRVGAPPFGRDALLLWHRSANQQHPSTADVKRPSLYHRHLLTCCTAPGTLATNCHQGCRRVY